LGTIHLSDQCQLPKPSWLGLQNARCNNSLKYGSQTRFIHPGVFQLIKQIHLSRFALNWAMVNWATGKFGNGKFRSHYLVGSVKSAMIKWATVNWETEKWAT